jgi:Spy/CpxP family protein refolding chaperone
MKKIFFILLLMTVGLPKNQVIAQVNRQAVPNAQTTPQKHEAPDPVESTMTFLKKELKLDSFQEAAIKIYAKENIEASKKISDQNISYEEKLIQYEKVVTIFDEKVIKILNPEQVIKFQELQAKRINKNQSNGNKNKKNKKDKKDKKEE